MLSDNFCPKIKTISKVKIINCIFIFKNGKNICGYASSLSRTKQKGVSC